MGASSSSINRSSSKQEQQPKHQQQHPGGGRGGGPGVAAQPYCLDARTGQWIWDDPGPSLFGSGQPTPPVGWVPINPPLGVLPPRPQPPVRTATDWGKPQGNAPTGPQLCFRCNQYDLWPRNALPGFAFMLTSLPLHGLAVVMALRHLLPTAVSSMLLLRAPLLRTPPPAPAPYGGVGYAAPPCSAPPYTTPMYYGGAWQAGTPSRNNGSAPADAPSPPYVTSSKSYSGVFWCGSDVQQQQRA